MNLELMAAVPVITCTQCGCVTTVLLVEGR